MSIQAACHSSARRSLLSLLGSLALLGSLVTGLAVTAASTPSAAAFTAPSVVKDVNANSLTSGTLFGGRVEALAANPVNTQIVLAAIEFGGLWRSNDGGAHWAHVDSLPLTAMDDVKFSSS